jgi:uncharacterized RDD family membrane protein YckC
MQAPHPTPASLGRRFGALLIDWIACVLISGLFARPLTQGWAPVLVLIFEYGLFIGVFGATPGMYLLRLRCVRVSDGGPIGIPKALLRGLLLALVVPALIMDNGRGLHDKAAGSVVLNATPEDDPRKGPEGGPRKGPEGGPRQGSEGGPRKGA